MAPRTRAAPALPGFEAPSGASDAIAEGAPGDRIAAILDPLGAIEPRRAMAVLAHPDDCEFMCGGTVALLTSAGWEVDIVVATSGNKGTKDPTQTPQRLAGTREEEQRRAAAILGANEPLFWGFPDGALRADDELRGLVVRVLRERRPGLVLTWDGFRAGFSHRDHREIGRATYDAIYPASDDRLYYPLDEEDGLGPHRPSALLLGGTDRPGLRLDIEPVVHTKARAVLAHASQVRRSEAELIAGWRARARSERAPKGAPALRESFRLVRF